MTALAWLLLSGAALVTVGLWLDRRYTDPLVARLCDDDEWQRLVAAVEGEDFRLWERQWSA